MATEQPNPDNTPAAAPADEPSLRDTIDAAFAQHATNEPAQAPEPSPAPSTVRDAFGRFAPKTGEPAPAAPGTGEPAAQAPSGPPAPAQQATPGQPPTPSPAPAPGGDLKAPAAWRPEARERWQQLDPQVQGEVVRRERELQTLMQSSAQHRQFVDAFEQIVRPYEVFIRQENSNPLQAVQNLMQTAATLRVGTPHDKVRVVAEIIGNFGIDVQMLDSLLAGQPALQQAAPQPLRDPRLDQLLAQHQQQQAQQAAQEERQMREGLEKFAETHEFYRDVAATMADLIDHHARRGEAVDLERIYQRACQLDDSVSNILAQRAAAQRAGQQSNAVLRAKRAAASVRGEPSVDTGTVPKDDTVRGAIEAAIEANASR